MTGLLATLRSRIQPVGSGIVAAVMSLTFLSCANPLRNTLIAAVSDYHIANTRVLASGSTLVSGAGLDAASPIVFEFGQGMVDGTVLLGGDLAEEAASPKWSSRDEARDTLTLSPATGTWSAGSERKLNLSFRTGNQTVQALSLSLGILDGVVYASDTAGSDSWPGTQDKPKKTIKAAIDTAAIFYGNEKKAGQVRVAGGTYTVYYSLGTHIRLVSGVSLLGGYSPSDWNLRDSPAWPSLIVDASVGTITETIRAVDCGESTGRETLFDGFTVRGGGNASTETGCAIYSLDAGPTIRNSTVIGGSAALTVGILVKRSTPLIMDCTIDGGFGEDSVGIFTSNTGPACLIENNDICGGSGNKSCIGIQNFGDSEGASAPVIRGNSITGTSGMTEKAVGVMNFNSDVLIEANDIQAGSCYDSGTGIFDESGSRSVIRNNIIVGGEGSPGDTSVTAIGIIMQGAQSTIQNNTICGGWTDPFYIQCIASGIVLGSEIDAAATVIENNIIFTLSGNSRTGIIQGGEGRNPASLANNLIFACPFALYSMYGSTFVYMTDAPDFSPYSWASGNISADPLFTATSGLTGGVQGSDWTLQPGSPAKGAGKILDGFTTDLAGTERGTSWSIGAYQ